MANLQETGLSFVAEGADAFQSALDRGAESVSGFEGAANTAAEGIDVFQTIAIGALLAIGEAAVEAMGKAVDAVVGFATESFAGAEEAEQGMVKLEGAITRMGDAAPVTYDEAIKLSQSLKDLAGGSDDAVISAETVLLRFQNISKEAFPEALKATLDLAAGMGMDLSSAAQIVGRALDAPGEGLNRLRRFGVRFSEDEKELLKSLQDPAKALDNLAKEANKAADDMPNLQEQLDVARMKLDEMTAAGKASESQLQAQRNKIGDLEDKMGTGQMAMDAYTQEQANLAAGMSETERTAAAQNMILDKLTETFGGAALDKSKTFGEQMKILKEHIADAGETVMSAFLPPLEDLFSKYIEPNLPLLEEWAGSLANIITVLTTGDFSGGIFGLQEDDPFILGLFAAHDALMNIWNAIGSYLSQAPAILGGLWEKAQQLYQIFVDSWPAIEAQLIRVWDAAKQLYDTFAQSFPEIMKLVGDLTGKVTGEAGPGIQSAFDIIVQAINTATQWWKDHGAQVLAVVDVIINRVIPAIQAGMELMTTGIKIALDLITGDWVQLGKDVNTSTAASTKLTESIFGTSMENLVKIVQGIPGRMIQAGKDIIQGIITGIQQKANDVYFVLKNIVDNAINQIKASLGIYSPSKVAAKQIGAPLGEGIASGIWGALGSVQASMSGVTMEAMASISPPASGGVGGNYNNAPTNTSNYSMTINAGQANAGSVAMGFNTLRSLQGGVG